MIDEEMIVLMKKAGCHMLKFGLESGCNEILNNLKKGTTVEQAITIFNIIKKVQIETHAHMVIGSPGETEDSLKRTLKFLKKLNLTTVSFGILTPFPNTPLFDMIKHKEFKDGSKADLEKLHTTAFYNEDFGCKIPNNRLEKWVSKCYRSYYLRPSYLIQWLQRIINLNHLYRLIIAGSNIFTFAFTGQK